MSSSWKPLHVSIGNFNIDIALYIDRIPGLDEDVLARSIDVRPGGAATNYAVAVARYGHHATLVASVADSPLVRESLDILRELGVNLHLKHVNAHPGMVVILVYSNSARSMITSPGANAYLTPGEVEQSLLDSASVVHMATIPPGKALEAARRVREALVTYDPGRHARASWSELRSLLEHVDVFFMNRREYKELASKTSIKEIFDLGVETVVVKLGEKGAVALTRDGGIYHAYVKPQGEPVDSTGAGDAFDAFYNASYIDTKSVVEALKHGVSAGALKTLCEGSLLTCWSRDLFNKHLESTVIREVEEIPE
ncbi:MAG: PfkB family carbohydrate kinase [Desulfurococcus sp.]|nr:PfkB family carbohydrate kinase [Desulfurococcus sp.]